MRRIVEGRGRMGWGSLLCPQLLRQQEEEGHLQNLRAGEEVLLVQRQGLCVVLSVDCDVKMRKK